MKVKLTVKHEWIIIDKTDDYWLDVTTPHGHLIQFCTNVCYTNMVDETTTRSVKTDRECGGVDTKLCPLESVFSYRFCTNATTIAVFDIVSRTYVEFLKCRLNIAFQFVQNNLLLRVLDYDRECENTRCLQIISRLCEHVSLRPGVFELFDKLVKVEGTDEY